MHSTDSPPYSLTRPPRIWLVNLFFGPGLAPTGVLLESLAINLQQHGWQVEVLAGTAEYRTGISAETSAFQGTVHRFRCQSKRPGLRGKFWTWVWFYIKVAWFTLWRRMPDVVIVQTTPPFLHWIFALRFLLTWNRPKLILWNQDTYPETLIATAILRETSIAYRCLKWIAAWSGKRLTTAIALDGAMADRLRNQKILDVRIIPNWDVTPTNSALPLIPKNSNPQPAEVIQRQNDTSGSLPSELVAAAKGYRYKMAYTGNLGFGHDLTPLWSFLTRNPIQTDFLFLFVGEGDRTRELKSLVERNGWHCVKFWPYLPATDFTAFLNWADCGLVALELNCLGLMSPSKMHAWLGAGKPVLYLGPEGSNVTETLRAFDCGFIVDPRDSQGFDRVAHKILDDSENLAEMGRRARKAWTERHNSAVGLRAWQDVLSSLISFPRNFDV